MNIYGFEQELGASYGAERLCDNEDVYGIGIIKVDDEKSYLIQCFSTDDFTDGAPARAYYVVVKTDSIFLLDKLEDTSFDENNLDNGSVKKLKMEGFNLVQRIMSPIVED